MEHFPPIIQSINSWWALTSLVLIGFFALAWKHGDSVLRHLHDLSERSKSAEAQTVKAMEATQKLQKSLATNHGTEGRTGEAIDRITTILWDMEEHNRKRELREEARYQELRLAIIDLRQDRSRL